jgi:hypothetical protein
MFASPLSDEERAIELRDFPIHSSVSDFYFFHALSDSGAAELLGYIDCIAARLRSSSSSESATSTTSAFSVGNSSSIQ